MKQLRTLIAIIGIIAGVVAVALPAPAAQAINPFSTACNTNASATLCKSKGDSATSMVKNIINLLIYVVGIVSVIMIVIGGLRYTTSSGDASGTASAKNTIMYAIVGLVVAIMAFSIVNFVIGKL